MNIKNVKHIEPIDNLKEDKANYLKSGIPIAKSGNWDRSPKDIRTSIIYTSIQEMLQGKRFEDTRLYFWGLEIIKSTGKAWGYTNPEDFKNRGKDIMALYASIKSKGVLPIEEANPSANPLDNISIAVGRNGELLAFDGIHRLAIATLLGKKEITTNVVVRHEEWLPKKELLRSKIGEKSYSPIDHPDFEDIPYTWSASRLNLIKKDLKKESVRSILDIGANYGFFTFELSKEGYFCTAIENNKKYFEIMQGLSATNPFWVRLLRGSIFDQQKIEYDCILALNLFHHFLKTEGTYNELINLLHRMKSNVMYFQAHIKGESQMQGAYKDFSAEEFCQFILDNSCYSHCEYLGERKGRKIYKFK